MKKSKFEKLTNEIIENGKKTLDNLNDLIQGCDEKNDFIISSLSDSYSKTSEQIAMITRIRDDAMSRNKEADLIYNFKPAFDLEEEND